MRLVVIDDTFHGPILINPNRIEAIVPYSEDVYKWTIGGEVYYVRMKSLYDTIDIMKKGITFIDE